MSVFTYTDARANLKEVMDRAINDHEEVIVTRRKGEAVVVLSMEDWSAIQETLHLLSSPANARALRGSIAELDAGRGVERELAKP
ncbi:type II toxin-antitoxin system Phd/YefM family antitoxin [Pelagibacterium lacus]|uniref:Antitoxin n=1 Tax=Pelagibacterium lacus TaxID=2282655 RepID=A0A369W9C8_9HYPH|nr:type II toxin-antitoxin system prevent-host-death family antitoxin [Pelagibacterium lacus]RDE10589.1 type II toxin-antitoxin system prevent-host-death family antitoxin [Pelagibacterium lacus]